MSPSVKRALVALCLAVLAGSCARADDLSRCSLTILDTTSLEGPDDHAREVVPARPDFTLWDGGRFIRPPRVDSVFLVEREEGDRVVIRERADRRVRGWAAARDLVPVNQVEPFFTARIQANGRSAFPSLMRAVVRYHLHQADPALADLDRVLRIDPVCAAALERRAWILSDKDRRDPAVADVERAILLEPADPRHLFTRASLHQKFDREKPELAIADLDMAIRLDPTDPSLYLMRAFGENDRRGHKERLEDVKRALELGGQDPKVFLTAIIVMLGAGDYRAARQAMDARLKEHPDDDLAYRCRVIDAVIDMKQWRFPLAMYDLRRAIALEPGKEDAYLLRSMLRSELGFPPWKVRQDLDAAIRANPRNAQNYVARSVFWYERGDYGASLADLDAAARLAPNDAGIHERRALVLATCPDPKVRNGREAVKSATRACELAGWKNPPYLTTLAAAYSETGDFPAAVRNQKRAIELIGDRAPETAEYQRLLNRFRMKKPHHALGVFQELVIMSVPAAQKDE